MDVMSVNMDVFTTSKGRRLVSRVVIVCIMTGATNILALEGLETADVVQALERHASRHGIQAAILLIMVLS